MGFVGSVEPATLTVGPTGSTTAMHRSAVIASLKRRDNTYREFSMMERVFKKPWVEPTIPQHLVDEAKEQGFRLRPKYHDEKIGYVISDCNKKTRTALVERFVFFSVLGVYTKRSRKIHFHDEYETSKVGDVVVIAPCRKLSGKKAHRLVEI